MKYPAGRGGPSVVILALLLALAGPLHAAGDNCSGDADLEAILEPIDQGRYEAAIERLNEQLDYDPDSADILTLLGFSYRKTRRFDDAPTFYQWALRVEPKHRGANENLGELFLETDQLGKAFRQLEILDDLCALDCREYSQLKEAIDSYQKSASNS